MEATFRIHNPTENKVEDLQINSRRQLFLSLLGG